MTRGGITCLALGVLLSAGLVGATTLTPPQQDTIWIEVDPQDLDRCHETLAQVAMTPAVTDGGARLWGGFDDSLPAVACVARTI